MFSITVPPLRDRIEDIPLLVWAFVKEFEKPMGKAIDDLEECLPEFRECRTGEGIGRADSLVECLDEGNTCTSRANDDKARACSEFAEDLEDAYEDARRKADRKDVEEGLEVWLETQSSERRECLRPARRVFRVCAGRPIARSGNN